MFDDEWVCIVIQLNIPYLLSRLKLFGLVIWLSEVFSYLEDIVKLITIGALLVPLLDLSGIAFEAYLKWLLVSNVID